MSEQKKGFDVWVDDISQLRLDTQSGALTVVAFQRQSRKTPEVQFHFAPQAVRRLHELLSRAQQVLEIEVEGEPPSDVRH
ncbi:hypothetical protein [Pseudomonas aeruginosa]|uniref:hypothetical protein n=1 Tax=Pseudomonas aeruginosa TaxID=287 RepID=UPI0011C3CADA|nr:hypothetical protein [Pseudomonas aeruginosa]QLF40592.1 hypothetical protein GNT62_14815 [Pseudomonas aeruginosa]